MGLVPTPCFAIIASPRSPHFCRFDDGRGVWMEAEILPDAHKDWVRDVAWAPTTGGSPEMIASCSQVRERCDLRSLIAHKL